MFKSALAIVVAMLHLTPWISSAPACQGEWIELATRGFLPDRDGASFAGRSGAMHVRAGVDGFRFRALDGRGLRTALPELRLELVGAAAGSVLVAEDPLPGLRHEFLGADPTAWRTGLRAYRTVRIAEAYAGIDVLLELGPSGPRLRLELSPGADPGEVELRWHGADSTATTATGGLSFTTALGILELDPPLSRQDARWVDHGCGRVRFEMPETGTLASTATSSDLIWSTYYGGIGSEVLYEVATGRGDQVTVAGTAFHIFGAIETSVLVARFDTSGPTQLFAADIGGDDFDDAEALAVDDQGRIYVGGSTFSDDFPLVNAIDPVSNNPYSGGGSYDAFLLRLADDGATLEFSTFWGGSEQNRITDVALAPGGDVVVVGETWSDDLATTAGAFMGQPFTFVGDIDAFVSRFSADGQQLLASTYGIVRQ